MRRAPAILRRPAFPRSHVPTFPPRLQVFSLQDLAGDILTVVRLRLKRFLDFLETSPSASGALLASLDADTCQWVRSARESEAAEAVGNTMQSDKAAGEPLRSTHGVLLCLARALPRESRYKVGDVWGLVGCVEGAAARYRGDERSFLACMALGEIRTRFGTGCVVWFVLSGLPVHAILCHVGGWDGDPFRVSLSPCFELSRSSDFSYTVRDANST